MLFSSILSLSLSCKNNYYPEFSEKFFAFPNTILITRVLKLVNYLVSTFILFILLRNVFAFSPLSFIKTLDYFFN